MKTIFSWIVVLGSIMLVIAGENTVTAEQPTPTPMKVLAEKAKELTGYFSTAKTVVEVGEKLAEALGIIDSDNANMQFDALYNYLTTVATGINFQAVNAFI